MRLLIAGVVVLLLTGCGVPGLGSTCQDAAAAYLKDVEPLLASWDDANMVASSTNRIALAPQVTALQVIRRDVDALTVDDCLKATHANLVDSMDSTISGYLAFMKEQDQLVVETWQEGAERRFKLWQDGIQQINNTQ